MFPENPDTNFEVGQSSRHGAVDRLEISDTFTPSVNVATELPNLVLVFVGEENPAVIHGRSPLSVRRIVLEGRTPRPGPSGPP